MKQKLSDKEKVLIAILIFIALIGVILSVYYTRQPLSIEAELPVIKNKVGYQTFMTVNGDIPKAWNKLARDITTNYNSYDSFLILAEPNTICYLGSALSFILEGLQKPVILTTHKNIEAASNIAFVTRIPEVMIFDRKYGLLRANRTLQFSDNSYISGSFEPLSDNNNLGLVPSSTPFSPIYIKGKIKVTVVKMSAELTGENLINYLENSDAGVIELYGDGSTTKRKDIAAAIDILTKKGIILVFISQSINVHNFITNYTQVSNGGDMTVHAAVTKLYFLLSNVSDRNLIPSLIEMPLRGELSVNKQIKPVVKETQQVTQLPTDIYEVI